MKNLETTLNIGVLPKMAQLEISDFYEFLKQKYEITDNEYGKTDYRQEGLGDFLKDQIKVNKIQRFTREELNERKTLY